MKFVLKMSAEGPNIHSHMDNEVIVEFKPNDTEEYREDWCEEWVKEWFFNWYNYGWSLEKLEDTDG